LAVRLGVPFVESLEGIVALGSSRLGQDDSLSVDPVGDLVARSKAKGGPNGLGYGGLRLAG
jgi:hypothetical protein